MKRRAAFTVVELISIVVVVAILAMIMYFGYGSWQHNLADKTVQHDGSEASASLEMYRNSQNYYPSNLAGTGFAASNGVAMKLMTNAQQTPFYQNLSPDQNAQLLLNSCNANMPTTDGTTIYNTLCAFAGNNFHIKGQVSSNVLLQGPTIEQSEFALTCGTVCDVVEGNILSIFQQQGGTWPVTVPKNQVALPNPIYIPIENTATDYCLEATSINFGDIAYHTTPLQKTPVVGVCPNNPLLHYP